MKLVVGLGNPGKNYDKTRHNVGFLLIDKYLGDVLYKDKFNGLFYKTIIGSEEVIFLKPTTFMNLSGECVVKYMNYFDIEIEDLLIIQDDLDMNVGTFKIKRNSSSGGHNGIKSIEQHLKSKDTIRFKVGINSDKKNVVNDFVLGKFSKEENDLIDNIDSNKIIDMFIKFGYVYTINNCKE